MRTLVRVGLSMHVAAFLGALPPAIPSALAQEAPDVACARPARTDAPPIPPWAEQLRTFATGTGVRVAVIDTGVAASPEFTHLTPGADFVTPDSPDPLFDCDGHGTVVAGIIAGRTTGIAPDAEILSIRQTSAHYRNEAMTETEDSPPVGSGSVQTLTDALNNALDKGAQVINTSVVSCVDPRLAPRVDTGGLDAALARAEAQGAVVVSAAGNRTGDCPAGSTVFPAHSPTVLVVGARADAYTMADYSLAAPQGTIPLSAPGQVDAAPASDGNGWAVGTLDTRDEVMSFEGTSFAAPVVSGTIAALWQRRPDLSPAEVRELIQAAAEPNGGAVDPLAVLTHIPAAAPERNEPLTIQPVHANPSTAPGRLNVLAATAGALLAVAAVGAAMVRSNKHGS